LSQAKRPVRRRGGLIPRLVFALATTLLLVELGLRLLLGNGGQGLVVGPSSSREVCFDLVANQRVLYTGDAVRADRTWITTNAVGTRGAALEEGHKLRVAVLGDDFTFGPGVEDDQTLTAVMERDLQGRGYDAQVVNLAVPGTAPPQAVARLERTLERLQPNAAVLIVAPNDLDPGASECPHDGVVAETEVLSAIAAQRQLAELLTTRVYIVRAVRLVQDAGLTGLLDRRGPYGPGRERRADPEADQAISMAPVGPVFARAEKTPEELWGDVPILLPSKRQIPAVVPEGREEYTFVAAVERLRDLGAANGFPVSVVVLADRPSFQRISDCAKCRTPQRLLSGHDGVQLVDLAPLWSQMLREPGKWFQHGEGWLNDHAHEEIGRTVASELASWPELRSKAQ